MILIFKCIHGYCKIVLSWAGVHKTPKQSQLTFFKQLYIIAA